MLLRTYVLTCALTILAVGSAHAQQAATIGQTYAYPAASHRSAELWTSAADRPRPLPPIGGEILPVQHLTWSEEFSAAARVAAGFEPQALPPHVPVSHVASDSSLHNAAGHTAGASAVACCDPCCTPVWAHRSGLFGEYLLLRARNADVAYAVPIEGGIGPPIFPPPVQWAPVAVANPEYDSGFRVGGTYAFDCESSMTLSYSRFESNVVDVVSTGVPLALRQLVPHPQTTNAATDFLDAMASLGVDYDLIDLDYRAVMASTDSSVLNYQVGIRYARFVQDFEGTFTNGGITEVLSTGVDFEGVGVRLGLDGERHLGRCGLFVYGRGTANIIAGESSGYYVQSTVPAAPEVDTAWRAGRMITILELELGGGWQSCCGRYRLSGGYQFNSWQDLVTADQFIEGVQNNSFVDMSDTVTFDGLNARFEYRW